MAQRRNFLKAGLAGVLGTGLLGTAGADADADAGVVWQSLEVRNPGSQRQRVTIEVDGLVALGQEATRGEDTAENRNGRGLIRAVLDPGAIDSFWVDGEIESVDWTGAEPVVRLNGRRLDLDDYRDTDDAGDDDDDDFPSRVQFVATDDDLEAFLRVSGRVRGGDTAQEIRVRLDQGRVRTVRYSGNVRELRVADGEVDIDISQA